MVGGVARDGLAGAVGGAVGTALLEEAMKAAGRLPEWLRPPALVEAPWEHVTWRAEMRARLPLPPRTHALVGRGLGFAYGMLWPAVVALAAGRARFRGRARALGVGAGVGAAVWAVGYLGWLPAAHLLEPRMKRRLGRQLAALAAHVIHGAVSLLLALRAPAR